MDPRSAPPATPPARPAPFWSLPLQQLLAELGTEADRGLSESEAAARLARLGPNQLEERQQSDLPALLLRQFCSPIVVILIVAAALSFGLRDPTDGGIILLIVLASGLLGFWQERGAARAVDTLLRTVELQARVRRGGLERVVPTRELVKGDVVLLRAGDGIPADCRLLAECDLFVNEAALTGESFPVDKSPGVVSAEAPLPRRSNVLLLGTHVVSGSGVAVVVHTGRATAFGQIAERIRLRPPQTEFEHGVRRFGALLLEITLVLVITIFAVNVYLQRPVLQSFLFALALAVGLTPQLLPAIISVNLARGAQRMADQRVIVRRLAAIEDFGSMDLLCCDKTGTLTEGNVRLQAALDAAGRESDRVLLHAWLNARFETSFPNPIDDAIRSQAAPPASGWRKLDELPYDFQRKRLSVLVEHGGEALVITKGALANVLDVCRTAEQPDGDLVPLAQVRAAIEQRAEGLNASGLRTLGVALRPMGVATTISPGSEAGMTFLGLLAFADPPKPGIARTLAELERLGVRVKIISGDNPLVAVRVGEEVGLSQPRLLTGADLRLLSDAALPARARDTDIFAEIEPSQKERIVRALRQAGHVVGYMGDGINDAPALHAADVSISVQGAVDAAKEAADILLLDNDLNVLQAGVREGRRTFANTLKYVFMATSANFGNMVSMAAASLLLPFLPLLPKQVLLTNLLTDLPELSIATDRVDADWIERPRRWNVAFIRRFMVVFGLVSSLYDGLTFAVLVLGLRAGPAEFRTGWFVESVVSASLIVLVVRTRHPLLGSRPSRILLLATVLVVVGTVALPFSPIAGLFGFVPLPPGFLAVLALIVLAYTATAERAKRWFYQRRGADL
ncbi:MAG: magnesium-translocating P-type ATPase [Cyanobium sp. Prado107]|nr:magnesium-translocating P-type ATPase [Cyanobium sp. Prado107]